MPDEIDPKPEDIELLEAARKEAAAAVAPLEPDERDLPADIQTGDPEQV